MATVGARIVNAQLIEAALIKAFEIWAEEDVNDKFFSEQFIDRQWPYPGPETIRKERAPAGDPRDIYDTGALFKSGQESFVINKNVDMPSAEWHWNAKNNSIDAELDAGRTGNRQQGGMEYAFYVHEGKGPYSRVPRRWTEDLVIPSLFEQSDAKIDLGARINIEFAHLHGR